MSQDKTRYVLGEVKNTTDRAILVALTEYEGDNGKIVKTMEGPVWFPRSQIVDDDFIIGEQAEIEATSWIMKQKGLV